MRDIGFLSGLGISIIGSACLAHTCDILMMIRLAFDLSTYTDYLNSTNGLDWALDFSANVFPNVLPRPVHPEYSAMSSAIQPLFHDALSGATAVVTALKIMDEEVNIILGASPIVSVSTIITTVDTRA